MFCSLMPCTRANIFITTAESALAKLCRSGSWWVSARAFSQGELGQACNTAILIDARDESSQASIFARLGIAKSQA